jgi:sec-independent protein translocase protein TatA
MIVVVVLFGPKRLPELGQSIGEGIRNFKKGLTDSGSDTQTKIVDKSDSDKS